MKLEEIKKAVDEGKIVHWANEAYKVIKDDVGQYFIRCTLNNDLIGLTWRDGVTLNGKEEEFFTKTWEYCPHCENEVELKNPVEKVRQRCPVCGEMILPCSICSKRTEGCRECAIKENEPEWYVIISNFDEEIWGTYGYEDFLEETQEYADFHKIPYEKGKEIAMWKEAGFYVIKGKELKDD